MITELMMAMVEQAPKKARRIQDRGKGKLEAYVRMIVQQAEAEIAAQNVPENDPSREVMVREMAMALALETALAGEPEPEQPTM